MRCPRREESAAALDGGEDVWLMTISDGFRTCSFCGSMHPDDALAKVEQGQTVIPTDKDYKMYVSVPGRGRVKVYFQHFDDCDQDRLIRAVNDGKVMFGYPGGFYRLPFFAKLKGGDSGH